MKDFDLVEYLKKRQFFVISPHLDDAILSMGMLLYRLKKYGKGTVINVFTKARKRPYTLSAKKFIKSSKYSDASDLFDRRKIEDQNAISQVNAKVINLGMYDALFRKKTKTSLLGKYIAEFDHIYPTYRWHVLKKIQAGDTALEELKLKLKRILRPDAIVFSPFGIGNHADHIITRKVCSQLFKKCVYYIDFPYNIRLNDFGNPPPDYHKYEFDVDLPVKSRLAHFYSTQINELFPGGVVPSHKEKFFFPSEL